MFETFSTLKIDYFSKLEFSDQKCSFGTVCDLAHDSGQMATAKWQTKIKVEVMMILCVSSAKKNGFSGSTNGTYFPPPSGPYFNQKETRNFSRLSIMITFW